MFNKINEMFNKLKDFFWNKIKRFIGQNSSNIGNTFLEEACWRGYSKHGALVIRDWYVPKNDSYFMNIKDTTSTLLGQKVKGILPSKMFYKADMLTSIHLSWDEEDFEIEDETFSHCKKLELVNLDNCKIIWKNVFDNCDNLREIRLSSNVTIKNNEEGIPILWKLPCLQTIRCPQKLETILKKSYPNIIYEIVDS